MIFRTGPLFCSKGHRWDPFRDWPLPSEKDRLVCPKCHGLLRVVVPLDQAAAEQRQEKKGLIPALLIAILLFPAIVTLTWLSVSRWAVRELAVSSDGKTVAVARGTIDGGGRIQVWDLATGQERAKLGGEGQRIFGSDEDVITSPVFTPDGKQLFVVRPERFDKAAPAGGGVKSVGAVLKWDFASSPRAGTFKKHTALIRSLTIDPGGKYLLVADWDRGVSRWELAGGAEKGKFSHPDGIHCLAIDPSGQLLATGTLDGSIYLWDLATGKQQSKWSQAHQGLVKGLAFDPTGKVLASVGGLDHTLGLWDPRNGTKTEHVIGLDWLTSVAFAPDADGRRLAVGGGSFNDNGQVQLWDIKTGKPEGTFRVATNTVICVAFTRDGKYLLAGSGHATSIATWHRQGRIYYWDLATGAEHPSLP
jgi:WD40 repeat protein